MTWIPANYSNCCTAQAGATFCQTGILTFLTFLSQNLSHSYDSVNARKEKANENDSALTQFDFIIVGAGSAGCVVANRLSEVKNWKILLLEEGDEEPFVAQIPGMWKHLLNSSMDYSYQTEPEPASINNVQKKKMSYPQGKGIGGSSSINSMLYSRGLKSDYDHWKTMGNEGWGWEDVLPYFKKSEDMRIEDVLSATPESHGTNGYLTVETFPMVDPHVSTIWDAWKELGLREIIDYNNGSVPTGIARTQFTTDHGSRLSTNSAFIRPIRGKRSNLIIKSNSRVTKIIIDQNTKQAIGVKYMESEGNAGKITKVYASKEVIVSAGTFNSPKLLMISGVGPAKDLRKLNISVIKDLPVGKNLQDHVSTIPVSFTVNDNKPININCEKMQNNIISWLNSREGPLTIPSPVFSFYSFYKSSFEEHEEDFDIKFSLSYMNADRYETSMYTKTINIFPILMAPKSRGYLQLNENNPVDNQPDLHFNYFDDSQDVKVLVEGLRFALRLVNATTLKGNGFNYTKPANPNCNGLRIDSDEFYECLVKHSIDTRFHAVGTCKMGPSNNKSSVVSSELMVHGINGLRVIDASIMPVIVRANTNAPTIMIAEKGSDLIKKKWL